MKGCLSTSQQEASCQAGAQFPLHVRRCSGKEAAAAAPSMEVVAVADIAAGSCICEFSGGLLASVSHHFNSQATMQRFCFRVSYSHLAM